jgi:hypothetical protein
MIGRPKIAHRSLSVLALRTGTAEFESAGSDEWLLAHFLELEREGQERSD